MPMDATFTIGTFIATPFFSFAGAYSGENPTLAIWSCDGLYLDIILSLKINVMLEHPLELLMAWVLVSLDGGCVDLAHQGLGAIAR